MPKTRSRTRGRAKSGTGKQHSSRPLTAATSSPRPERSASRPVALPARSMQGLFMSALVALGCWAFAYYTFLSYRDTNSYLFAGMAALLALVWSIIFFVRLRKWRRGR